MYDFILRGGGFHEFDVLNESLRNKFGARPPHPCIHQSLIHWEK